MAKFRNVDKRRPWENPQQKRARKMKEALLMGKQKWEAIGEDVARASEEGWPAGAAKSIVERYKLGNQSETVFSVKRDVSLTRFKDETWSEFFGLKFYRFQKWFGRLWVAAGFQKVGVCRWTGGIYETIAYQWAAGKSF